MRLDHLLSKENCVGQTRGSAIGEGTEVVVQFSVRDSSLKEKRDPINQWGCSSVGRAPALQAGGHGFESHHLHQSVKKNKSRKPVEQYRIEPACSSGG